MTTILQEKLYFGIDVDDIAITVSIKYEVLIWDLVKQINKPFKTDYVFM